MQEVLFNQAADALTGNNKNEEETSQEDISRNRNELEFGEEADDFSKGVFEWRSTITMPNMSFGHFCPIRGQMQLKTFSLPKTLWTEVTKEIENK